METIVLVHGSWMDASCWNKVIPFLEKAGNEVIAVNLPGHGKDNSPPENLTMRSYADAVKEAISYRADVTLVGHSMGGMVISQTAELIPDKIKKLVYICARLPVNGQSLLMLASQDPKSQLSPSLISCEDKLTFDIKKENVVSIFYADTPEDIKVQQLKNLKPEPAIPFSNPVKLTDANFGKVEKAYVYALNDNAITFDLQKQMVKNSNVGKTYELHSSHTPFFSMPEKVAEIILVESK